MNAALLAGVYVGVYPFTVFPDLAWGVFVVTTFLISAAAHMYYTRTEMHLRTNERPPELE